MYGTFSQLDDATKIELWSYMALKHTSKLGVRRINRLCKYFGSAHQAVLNCKKWGVCRVPADAASSFRSELWREPAKQEWGKLRDTGCGIILQKDFPLLLKDIIDAPLYLYYWGDVSLLFGSCIAVVGSRRCSSEGLASAARLSNTLASIGFTVVSGMAHGIDREAHLGAINELGSSIAVLGTGINKVYPPINLDIFTQLIDKGLIISELAPDCEAEPRQFPIRNRIISGLSLGVVVVEAAQRSGSLITARHALEQNRQVYAVPGLPDAESSVGCNDLLNQGAIIVRNIGDILVDLKESLTGILEQKNKNETVKESRVCPDNMDVFEKRLYIKRPKTPAKQQNIQPELKTEFKRLVSDDQGSLIKSIYQNDIISTVCFENKNILSQQNKMEELKGSLSELEFNIVSLLNKHTESLHIDKIVELLNLENATSYEVSDVSSTITILEIRGFVFSKPGLRYVIGKIK
ncbi:DNA-processing protein DprA [Desulfovibrio litoralis]|uniref:DNA protecting protein DprA n=1 Tax=Desulfovibrio litoralis DSM 11393 TaxID=1121455 RepID=A0A1M7RVI5_9BACT|nr:DNA-processing protein DprA [Desulfovibrio litoralis]SHN50251.1 DNA protecting protein DprA [Desulfovibrio litoralis DSM 11393]